MSSSSTGAGNDAVQTQTLHYPLTVSYNFFTGAKGNSTQVTRVNQQYLDSELQSAGGVPVAQSALSDAIETGDTLFFDPNFNVTGHKSQSETATYLRTGTDAACFKRTLVATFDVLTAVQTGC